jgi:hypothetical protein
MLVDPWWKAEACAADVLKQQNITKLPIDPFQIANAKDILHQENPSLDAGISGCLMRVGDHFGIVYSTRYPSNGFRRFTVGHELGHYFLEGHPEHLFKDGCTLHTSTTGFISDDRYEQEADAFAASLLMPKSLFRGLWLKFGASPEVIRRFRAAGERGATQYLLVRTSAA